MNDALRWLEGHEDLLWAAGIASVLVFVGSLALVPLLVARLPADYFATRKRPQDAAHGRHPLVHRTLLGLKNVVGALLLLAGIAMLVLPGQGLLTILAAIVLLDFPGKRRLELAVVRRERVLRALNWVRRRSKHPPFERPWSDDSDGG